MRVAPASVAPSMAAFTSAVMNSPEALILKTARPELLLRNDTRDSLHIRGDINGELLGLYQTDRCNKGQLERPVDGREELLMIA